MKHLNTSLPGAPQRRSLLGCVPAATAVALVSGGLSPLAAARAPRKDIHTVGVPWEGQYGYVQAVKIGEWLYVSGQLSHDEMGNQVAPAPLDRSGKVIDFTNMEAQMRQTYANAGQILKHYAATPDHVVEEVLYVLDMDAAFAVAGAVRKHFYGSNLPHVASTILVTPRLAFPTQLIEVKFVARL
jgi:enamine deaminase RidA (YjgF/YER057c/UK114 family)